MIFWRIDYYADETHAIGSEDPADTARTFRILTIMLASSQTICEIPSPGQQYPLAVSIASQHLL
jgi:hypothetical protein